MVDSQLRAHALLTGFAAGFRVREPRGRIALSPQTARFWRASVNNSVAVKKISRKMREAHSLLMSARILFDLHPITALIPAAVKLDNFFQSDFASGKQLVRVFSGKMDATSSAIVQQFESRAALSAVCIGTGTDGIGTGTDSMLAQAEANALRSDRYQAVFMQPGLGSARVSRALVGISPTSKPRVATHRGVGWPNRPKPSAGRRGQQPRRSRSPLSTASCPSRSRREQGDNSMD